MAEKISRVPEKPMFSRLKLFWRRYSWLRHVMRHKDYLFLRYVNKIKLLISDRIDTTKDEGITVVVGVKNRCDYRLINAFKSIRNQDYDSDLIDIILVDYDSNKELIQGYKEICEKYDVMYLRVENKPIWNKSHCINIAIKLVGTKYICSSDVDVFFERNYFSECIKELQRNPYQVIISNFYSTPEGLITDEVDVVKDYSLFKKMCGFQITEMGLSRALNPGINLTLSRFYKAIHGYDEFYTLWGSEDFDIIKRFFLMGLNVKDISKITSWIHQFHEKHENTKNHENYKDKIRENKQYLLTNHTIIRNLEGWGR